MGDATPTGRFEASFYFDLDRDGQRDPGEPDAFAFIHAFDQNTWETVADLYGPGFSAEVPVGSYGLHFGNVDVDLWFGPFDVSGGASTIFERGFLPGRIDIVTFLDADGDGVFDAGEEHPYGLKLYLFHQYHAPGSVSSLDGPAFSFAPLLPGPYEVRLHDYPPGETSAKATCWR